MIREQIILRENKLRLITAIFILLATFAIIFAVPGMLLSFILAFVITYLLSPVVSGFERTGLTRSQSIVLPYLMIAAALAFLGVLLTPLLVEQFNSLTAGLPNYVQSVKTLIANSESKINSYITLYNVEISDRVGVYLETQTKIFLDELPARATQLLTVLVLAPFFAFFLLKDGRTLYKAALSIVPNNFFEMVLFLSHKINAQLGDFVRARLLEAGIVGIVVWLGLFAVNFPYATFLALFAALTNLIPYIGPIIGAIPAFALCFINKDPSSTILLVAAVYFVAQLIDMLFIIPMVVAKIVNLHPITVVVAIIIGSETMGILGMIISIPIASVIKLTFNTIFERLIAFKIN